MPQVRIAVFGAGAIGGLMAARLSQAGAEVTVVARGAHLAAMRANGIRLIDATRGEPADQLCESVAHPRCIEDPIDAGPQDYVVLTLKAHGLPSAAPQIARMLGPETAVVSAINGVPWWYFHGLGSPFGDRCLETVDPGGAVSALLPHDRAIGCIVYPAAEVTEPGVIRHTYGDRFTLGEPDGSRGVRVERLSQALIQAGFKAPVRPRLRDELWVKLWGNLAFNPISVLTCATLDRIIAEPETRDLARAMMLEAKDVAEALGVRFVIDVDKRIAGAAEVGAHKTSMLQDLERGRPLEIEALLGAVVEMAGFVGKPMPICGAILGLVRQRARIAGTNP